MNDLTSSTKLPYSIKIACSGWIILGVPTVLSAMLTTLSKELTGK